MKHKDQKKPKKIEYSPLNIILICLSFAVLFFYIFYIDGAKNIIATIKLLQMRWLFVGILLMIVFWYMEAICLHLPLKLFNPKQPFKNTFSISMIGQYFNSLTPFSTGGQPMQAYYMYKDGVSVGASLSSMLVKLIIYQFVLTVYSSVILIFQTSFFYHKVKGFVLWSLAGFLLNIVVIISLICMGYFKRFSTMIGSFFVKAGVALHLVRDQYSALKSMIGEVSRFHRNYRLIRENKNVVLQMMICTAFQLTAYFAVTYAIYRSFSLSEAHFFAIISAQAFVLLLSSFIPLPGAIGASEGSFYLFFGIFFPPHYLAYAILAWRLITFYMPIVVGAGFTLVRRDAPEPSGAN